MTRAVVMVLGVFACGFFAGESASRRAALDELGGQVTAAQVNFAAKADRADLEARRRASPPGN